jgi:TolA-binding protein
MNVKFITLTLVTLVATSSAFAFGGPQGWMNCSKEQSQIPLFKQRITPNNGMQEMMMALSEMELSKAQWNEIRKVLFDARNKHFDTSNQQELMVLINNDGTFDKEGFIKSRALITKEMIDTQAKSIEKVLHVLTDDQRKALARKLTI